jgi:hypothetical protein
MGKVMNPIFFNIGISKNASIRLDPNDHVLGGGLRDGIIIMQTISYCFDLMSIDAWGVGSLAWMALGADTD